MKRALTSSLFRSVGLLVLVLGTAISGSAQRTKQANERVTDPGASCDSSAWKLVFHDEFNGSALDRSKWITYYPYSNDGSDQCEGCRFMSGTNSIYMEELVTVSNGMLRLGVEAEPATWYSVTTEHKGSTIRSIGSAEFTYGKFEIRCRLPEGKGLWPAFWMYGGQTEIDVFEVCGEKPKWVKGSLHQWGEQRRSNTGKYKGEDHSEDFHIFSVEWDRDELRWYVDGEVIHSRGRFVDDKGKPLPGCDREAGTHELASYFPRAADKVNVIAGNAVSEPKGYCKGPRKPAPWSLNSALLVDWIRVYQRQPQEGLKDLCGDQRSLRITNLSGSGPSSDERLVEVVGPHGSLAWETGPGVRIVCRSAHGVMVTSNGRSEDLWIKVRSSEDPCSASDLVLEGRLN